MINLSELDYKKIILAILIFIATLVLLFGLMWLFFLRDGGDVQIDQPVTVTPGGALPTTGGGSGVNVIGPGGRLTGETSLDINNFYDENGNLLVDNIAQGSLTTVNNLLDEKIVDININNRGFNFLSGEDNKFYYLDKNGGKVLLSQEVFPFVDKVVWSGDGNKVVLSYPDGANLYYDFTKNKKITLPAGAENFSFDNSSDKIAYKFINNTSENNWLVVSDIQNKKMVPVEHLGDNGGGVQVTWSPNNQVVALYHEPTGLASEEVFFLGLNDENFKSLKVSGYDFKGIWSPQGDRILYHVISPDNNHNPLLAIADANGDNIGNHNFILDLTTWVDKCTFTHDNQTVYCAVPVDLATGAGIYPESVNDSEDVFYKINLNTGINTLIAYPILSEKLTEFQVGKLMVSDDDTKLYFLDNWTEKIYLMKLR